MRTNRPNGTNQIIWLYLIIVMLFLIIGSCSTTNRPNQFYLDHKSEIDDYRKRHENDWKGYRGSRRNSWGEEQALKSDGIDPEKYRIEHGY